MKDVEAITGGYRRKGGFGHSRVFEDEWASQLSAKSNRDFGRRRSASQSGDCSSGLLLSGLKTNHFN